jgi:branched-subunit amino acid transport protein
MTTAWLAILVLTAGTVAIKALGPVALGGRELPESMSGVVARLAPSLLAALVVVDIFGGGERTIAVDESAIGLLAAAGALALRLPIVAVVAIAAVVTAATRLI